MNMTSLVTHRLLQRQVRRHFGEISNIPENWHRFIAAIDQTYHQADEDLMRVERTLQLSSQELLEANAQLQTVLQSVEQQVEDRTRQLQRSLEFAQLLQSVTAEIRKTLDSQTILQTIVQTVRSILQTDRVVIYQFTPSYEGKIVVEDVVDSQLSILGEHYSDLCFPLEYVQKYTVREYICVVDDIHQAHYHPCHVAFLESIGVKANLVVPISCSGELWGLLIAHACDRPRHWQEFEVILLQQLADQAAIAIQQAELYEQSREAEAIALAQKAQLENTLAELKETQTQLIQSEKMSSLGQLVAGVAHEINNPVNFIQGNLQYASEYSQELLNLIQLYQQIYPDPDPRLRSVLEETDLEFLVDDFQKLIASMEIGVERIRQIVLTLRNFSRMDESEMKAVDIHEGIESTLLILRHRLQSKSDHKHAIHIIRDYGTLPKVECYPGQLNQVLMNILANAIDALEESPKFHHHDRSATAVLESKIQKVLQRAHHIEIIQDQSVPTVWIKTEYPSRDRIIIRIIDNGVGIPASIKAQLFDPFFTTKPIGKGTGLGLSISYQIIVNRHQGQLDCHSVPGLGTEFVISIPVSQSSSFCPTQNSGLLT